MTTLTWHDSLEPWLARSTNVEAVECARRHRDAHLARFLKALPLAAAVAGMPPRCASSSSS